jgi:phosphate transport system permease protein
VVPLIREYIGPYFAGNSSGYSVLAGGIVLAIMIAPMIVTVLMEVFSAVPKELKDASLSLGATKWQTVKFVLLKKSRPGIIAASVLAISRAFGETIAVMMVCGNTVKVPHSPFEAGYPLPALIANNYGEMLSVKLYDSALLFAALILFVIIFLFNAIARYILVSIERSMT